MKEKINACYERLQKLAIQPTKNNMEILLQTLYDLQEVYRELEGTENAGTENRAPSDSDGRDNH